MEMGLTFFNCLEAETYNTPEYLKILLIYSEFDNIYSFQELYANDIDSLEDFAKTELFSIRRSVVNHIKKEDTKVAQNSIEDQISDDEFETEFKPNQTEKKNLVLNGTNASSNSIANILATLPDSKSLIKAEIAPESDKLEDFIPTVKHIKDEQKPKKVKITIPSLSEFKDLNDDEPEAKRMKPSNKGSGLLGLLPPVKSAPLSNISFIPNTVQCKNIPQNNKATSSIAMIPHALTKKMETKKVEKTKKLRQKHDSDSDVSDSEDSFTIPETYDDKLWETICARPANVKSKDIIVEELMEEEPINIAPEPPKAMNGLDKQAFKQLVGKAKRPMGKINIIDINEAEILPDKEIWMTKALTDPELSHRSLKDDDPVDHTRRRKHHITYLAQQAKAQEQDLRNAWATGRNNRMMSRSKYGF